MWSDNETDADLLGFQYLVDSLEILLSEPHLLPVTVGVMGDWGSGKSSLMKMAAARIADRDDGKQFITVSFNPWQFEDFTQVKMALMDSVLTAIDEHLENRDDRDPTAKEKAKEKVKLLRKFGSKLGIARLVTTVAANQAGLGPEETELLASAAQAVAAPNIGEPTDQPAEPTLIESISDYHKAFEELLDELGDDFQALVVLIDDMDRCSPGTIVETFETIRLFLNAPKTAFVIGAHEAIIGAALEDRYPGKHDGDPGLGKHYLEKMLQASVYIPPLSEPESTTYINLLLAQLRLGSESENFAKLTAAAEEHRKSNLLDIAMNLGIASTALGSDMPDDLAEDLSMGDSIGPPISRGLRGNPRQIKRFLNTLELRKRVSSARGMDLDPKILSKLMVLESTQFDAFEQLFHWQTDQGGIPQQLKDAEAAAKGAETEDPAVVAWISKPAIKSWLEGEPSLADVGLGPYFTFSRDRMKGVGSASRLSPELQEILAGMRSEVETQRTAAVEKASGLETLDLADLTGVALEFVPADLGGKSTRSMIELARRAPTVADALFETLSDVQGSRVPRTLVTGLRANLAEHPGTKMLFETWEPTSSSPVKTAMKIKPKD